MNLTFLAPQFLWALTAVPVVIILHFVRARKRRTEVSALFLWKEAKDLAQQRRRFNPSWLLLLQILAALLAALALAQPTVTLRAAPDRILIVDASASMAARDSDGIRLEKAVREAGSLLRGAGRAGLIRAGLDATVIQPLTDHPSEVETALGQLVAADREANLGRALSLALSVAPGAEVHLFTDGLAPPSSRVTVHPVGGDGLNLGITTFDIGIQQAFVAVTSTHLRPQEVGLELLQDGAVIASTTLLVPSEGQANTTFPLQRSSGFFEARLLAPDWDALELDDAAFAGKRDLRVVLHAPDPALERALAALPNLNYNVLPGADYQAPGFDAHIAIAPLAAAPEAANLLLFAPEVSEPDYGTIRTWDRSDPLLRFVDLTETRVGFNPDAPPVDETGWEVLARSADLRPVLVRRQTETGETVAATFYPEQSDMVNRSAFPLFIANVMESFRAEEALIVGQPLPAGATLRQGEREVPRNAVTAPGLYTIDGETYPASLESAAETRLPPFTPAPTPVREASDTVTRRARDAALWLVALALAALLAEWLLWSRGRQGWAFLRRPRFRG